MQSGMKTEVTEIEEVSWVAWGRTKGDTTVRWFADASIDTELDKGYTLPIKNDNVKPAAFFAAMQSGDGGGGAAGVRYTNLNDKSVDVIIEEQDPSADAATHTKEVIGYLVLYGDNLKRDVLYHDTIVEFGTLTSEQSDAATW